MLDKMSGKWVENYTHYLPLIWKKWVHSHSYSLAEKWVTHTHNSMSYELTHWVWVHSHSWPMSEKTYVKRMKKVKVKTQNPKPKTHYKWDE